MNRKHRIERFVIEQTGDNTGANIIIDRALDLFGEFGCLEANPLAKAFRDARITTIFAGTTEIMKTIIAKSIGL